ncbi:hypothetical protein C8J56DRAFT_1091913 [Mycena floridula]|nr:hypothetical protein C8J56DRAFT_1091913 [Mycena floridula]
MKNPVRRLFKCNKKAPKTKAVLSVLPAPPNPVPVPHNDENHRDQPPKSSSPNVNASWGALKFCLEAVSDLGFPGVGTAATGLRRAVENGQAQAQVKVNIIPLQKRIERIWYYLKRAKEVEGQDPEMFVPLEKELEDLARDIIEALKQNRIAAFFNGTDDLTNFDSHKRDLDSHVTDLMFFIQMTTKQKTAALQEDCEKAVVALKAEMPAETGMISTLTDNEFEYVEGGYLTDNEIKNPKGAMRTTMSGNKIGIIKDGFLTRNKVD